MKLVTHNLCQSPFKQRLQQSLNNQMSFGTNTAPVNMPDWSSITPPQNMPLWNNDYKANNEYMGQDQLTKNINDYDLTHRSLWQPSAATLSTTLNLPKSNGEKRKKTKEEKLASLGKTAETIGNISSIVSSVLPENTAYSGKYGNITKGLDTAYDGILSEVSKLGPIGQTVAGFGKLGGALSKFSSAIGLGTDGETAIDAIFSSGPLGFNVLISFIRMLRRQPKQVVAIKVLVLILKKQQINLIKNMDYLVQEQGMLLMTLQQMLSLK